MNITVEETCPQCGGEITLAEDDRLLVCPFCQVRIFLQAGGVYRFVLPDKEFENFDRDSLLYAPYLRFKGTIFLVSDRGISHRAIDTTQLGVILPGLPPSLGVRPQAMKLRRLTEQTGGRYLPLSLGGQAILEKAIMVSEMNAKSEGTLYHRAFIGETISFIYLPLLSNGRDIIDGVTGSRLMEKERMAETGVSTTDFKQRWKMETGAALCPQCGWNLDGASNSVAMTCANCDSAWELDEKGLARLQWSISAVEGRIPRYLPFWKIEVQIPELDIVSFADFVVNTNQPRIPKREWRERPMSFWIPAFKLAPKRFVLAAKQMTLAQTNFETRPGKVMERFFPVTLPSSEARQAIKVCLAETSATRRRLFELLPRVRLEKVETELVYLPFVDESHDWLHLPTMTAIDKNILRFGRSM